MKKILLSTLLVSCVSFAYTYEFQNSTPYTVSLTVQFENGCKETNFDINASKIHTLKDQKCDIKSIVGQVHMQGKQNKLGSINAQPYVAREAKKRDGTWAIYGPLYSGDSAASIQRNKNENTVIEAKLASFRIARLIE